ncbi:signal peptidase II [Phytoactinopolyspora alkaliphila]|uniref:Lipoprotein signal peptidase n=1 Tax=Phytoactinopolyspora alkaliphila TaxID=1783498 RepID=A0A6N9YFR9_9ACTN|nr:signal peptidase II [Phytoactinopolyspora alkaliphila]NED93833.1 signal peptidase II [Phytoactinopolyspora alkaliphila]
MQTTTGASLNRDDTRDVRTRRRTAALLLIAAVVLILDQLTKVWAVSALDGGRVIQVIGEFLQFRLVRNPGAAFSMFTEMTVVLTVIAAGVIVVILWVSRKVTSLAWAVALGGLLGGALGTFTDRLFREPGPFRGHVVDFLELPNWPVFNIADSSIVGSAILIALLSFRGVEFSSMRRPEGDDGLTGRPLTGDTEIGEPLDGEPVGGEPGGRASRDDDSTGPEAPSGDQDPPPDTESGTEAR